MHLHILGICGTFMGSLAALAHALGHRVTGCDSASYPPMDAQLRALGLAHGIYPLLDVLVQRAQQPFIHAALLDTDRRVEAGKPVVASFLLACTLWQDVLAAWQQQQAQGLHSIPALHAAIDAVFERRVGDITGRGKLAADMREIWVMQPRFDKHSHIIKSAGSDDITKTAACGSELAIVEIASEYQLED